MTEQQHMKEVNALNAVAEFHTTFGHPRLDRPQIPDEARCRLCDIQYVLAGAVLEFGLGDSFSALFSEVQRSNMSKSCRTLSEAEETAAHYKQKDNTDCVIREINGRFLVYRAGDNKIMKSVYYSPAELGRILSETTGERP
jgi:GTPase involved in cell partitioning and DNA repair